MLMDVMFNELEEKLDKMFGRRKEAANEHQVNFSSQLAGYVEHLFEEFCEIFDVDCINIP